MSIPLYRVIEFQVSFFYINLMIYYVLYIPILWVKYHYKYIHVIMTFQTKFIYYTYLVIFMNFKYI
jgi:hypothetical protein